ncbi:MAG: DUF4248 domain-containing protein [Bacteroidaceae bacterium]|nr:DUF4248 domain-containing protein [Bacteroidaceae bacterium]
MQYLQEYPDEQPFPLRAYGRTELAALYRPDLTPKSAWRALRDELQHTPALLAALAETDYDPRRRHFTPRQVQLIVTTLGLP